MGSCIDMSPDEIIKKISNILEKDHTEQLYTALNNGDIKSQFGSKDKFIEYINSSPVLDFDLMGNILCIPNSIFKNGMNIIVFNKKSIIISKVFEKEKIREDFEIMCGNIEDYYSLTSPKENIILLKDGKNYYPIVLVEKIDETDKHIKITKTYKYEDKKDNIIILDGKKKILVGKYIFFGINEPENQLWIWASSIPGVNQKQIKLINEIKNKNYLFENDDNDSILFIYQLLTNDVIKLPDIKKFELINKTLNFLSDSIIIFNPINNLGNTQFIGLKNITEEYI
jgi:hypothetical protein